MIVKETWTEVDFESMGWHDSYIHAIIFPLGTANLALDIDYIFKWNLDEETQIYSFWVSPCILKFFDVTNLRFNLSFNNSTGLYIEDVQRKNPRKSPNGRSIIWDYLIFTDKGDITFECSDFMQNVTRQPIISESQVIERVNKN